MSSFREVLTPGLIARLIAQLALRWTPALLALCAAFEAGRWSAVLGH